MHIKTDVTESGLRSVVTETAAKLYSVESSTLQKTHLRSSVFPPLPVLPSQLHIDRGDIKNPEYLPINESTNQKLTDLYT